MQDVLYCKPEISGIRDSWISTRHRLFGSICYFADLDYVLTEADNMNDSAFRGMEYYNNQPVALIEYKHYSHNGDTTHPSFQALAYMADKCQIPAFLVRYNPEQYTYLVKPLNKYAQAVPWCQSEKLFSEKNYVKLMYWLRKQVCPPQVLARLEGEKK